jgi:1,4-alpha-glucan branching enzyme
MAFDARAAELRVLRAGARAGQAAVRELLAVQASDWPFMVSRSTAVPYARERFAGHLSALQRALDAGPEASTAGLRNLARDADPRLLTPFA